MKLTRQQFECLRAMGPPGRESMLMDAYKDDDRFSYHRLNERRIFSHPELGSMSLKATDRLAQLLDGEPN